jgi:hypothetical protein
MESSPQLSPTVALPEEVQAAFAAAGYQVDSEESWNWTRPPVTSFQVHDARRDRVLMVFVYSSITASEAARLEAETHEAALNGGLPVISDSGPHLIVGYGPSVWTGNVALVQTTESQLARLYPSQDDHGTSQYTVVETTATRNWMGPPVDADFQDILQRSIVNL